MQIVNEADALDRMGGDDALYSEIVQVFLEDTPIQIAVLQGALESPDLVLLRRQAHSIKSAAANVGAERLSFAALSIERGAEQRDLETCRTWLSRLQRTFAEVSDYFSQ